MYELWVKRYDRDWQKWSIGSLDDVLAEFFYQRDNDDEWVGLRIEWKRPNE